MRSLGLPFLFELLIHGKCALLVSSVYPGLTYFLQTMNSIMSVIQAVFYFQILNYFLLIREQVRNCPIPTGFSTICAKSHCLNIIQNLLDYVVRSSLLALITVIEVSHKTNIRSCYLDALGCQGFCFVLLSLVYFLSDLVIYTKYSQKKSPYHSPCISTQTFNRSTSHNFSFPQPVVTKQGELPCWMTSLWPKKLTLCRQQLHGHH